MAANLMARNLRICSLFFTFYLAIFSTNVSALEKPKFLGVYLENRGNLTGIGWRTESKQALPIQDGEFTIITYGIDLNPGAGDIFNPKVRVGIQEEGTDSYFLLNIEPLNMQDHYYRYHLPKKELKDAVYFFFINSRVWGNKDKYYFKIERKK